MENASTVNGTSDTGMASPPCDAGNTIQSWKRVTSGVTGSAWNAGETKTVTEEDRQAYKTLNELLDKIRGTPMVSQDPTTRQLQEELWGKQPATVHYLFYYLMAEGRAFIIFGVFGLICLIAALLCIPSYPNMAFALMLAHLMINVALIGEGIKVIWHWRKFRETSKPPIDHQY